MTTVAKRPTPSLAYNGYYRKQTAEPNMTLCGVGRGTPGGEWHRRFWQPVAYEYELTEVPLRVRALGEDLVCFRDRSGRRRPAAPALRPSQYARSNTASSRRAACAAAITAGCTASTARVSRFPAIRPAESCRNARVRAATPCISLPASSSRTWGRRRRCRSFRSATASTFPGLRIVPGIRSDFACNWLQVKENAVDPHHTHFLHVIPQLRGMNHFANEFGNFPEMTWAETPGGIAYFAARRVGDNVWVRSSEVQGSSVHIINSIFESGRERKPASRPFLSFWSLPVDDEHTINFFISHVADDEAMPFEERRRLEIFGQNADRPYRDRQWIPGDNEAMASQGPVNVHALEQLGSLDRGVAMYRRYVRAGIEAVQRGDTPLGVYRTEAEVPPTYANDLVIGVDEFPGDPDDQAALLAFAESLPERYRTAPPMRALKREAR